jgi:catechol 2,3-dioxygenase-like lactoylglutathione lyase family enzyme
MIKGTHAVLFSRDPEAVRAYFRDVLGFASVDAGGGWLIFALPPAELGVHPTGDAPSASLYLLCDDLAATTGELGARGAVFAGPVAEQEWGRVVMLALPDGGELGLYEPKHPTTTGARE